MWCVRGSPVEGEREEGGKTTLTQYELIMQQLIFRISKIPLSAPYVLVRSNLSVTVESQKYQVSLYIFRCKWFQLS